MPTPDLLPTDPKDIQVTYEPLKLFGGIFIASSLAGLAALLRSKQPIDMRAVGSALLNSGFIGTIIGMAWYANYKDTNLYFLISVSILAGLGGSTTLDFVLQWARSKVGMAQTPIDNKEEGK